ncbi:hypothetical protein [Burkholderia ambifaria]|uniref:hypothetical protein n=1 Tax=Burkholderia ambifaria TaxID=152480 RepID=UPI0015895865|nr:hypothetical protein [Burkholderia ambifaria]
MALRERALQCLLLVDELGKRVLAAFELGRGVEQQLPQLRRQAIAPVLHVAS